MTGDGFAVEVKHRKELPAWLVDAVAQARRNAGGRLPLVVIHQHGARHDGDLVVVAMGDWRDWFGGLDHGDD